MRHLEISLPKNEIFDGKLVDIDRRLARGWNSQLVSLQKQTWKLYEENLANEELLWFQKSRAKWLECGDRNTRYFHGVTTIRRQRNIISSLLDDNGS